MRGVLLLFEFGDEQHGFFGLLVLAHSVFPFLLELDLQLAPALMIGLRRNELILKEVLELIVLFEVLLVKPLLLMSK